MKIQIPVCIIGKRKVLCKVADRELNVFGVRILLRRGKCDMLIKTGGDVINEI